MSKTTLVLIPLLAAGAAVSAHAAVIRVGPGGDVATIQAGLDAAVATPEDDELRVRAGTYPENLVISVGDLGGALVVSGGWDATFTSRDPDPVSTVVDGGGAGRGFVATFLSAGSLTLRGLTFENGSAVDTDSGGAMGAGLYLRAVGIPAVVERCRFHANHVVSSNGAVGAGAAGAFVNSAGTASVTVDGVEVSDNASELDDSFGAVVGGGLRVIAQDSSTTTVVNSRFSGNQTTGPGQQRGCGLALEASQTAQIVATDDVLTSNHGSDVTDGSGVSATATNGTVDLRRLVVTDNRRDAADTSSQVYLRCFSPGTCAFRFSDSLVARGGSGLVAEASSGAMHVVNVTLADHLEYGTRSNVASPAVASFDNSIAWDNLLGDAVLLGGAFTEQANLVGTDPLFLSPAAGNYRLSPDSPARDAGTATPTGGLSSLALGGVARVAGPAPDQGAYEMAELFSDGFETGDTTAWSTAVP